MAGRPRSPSLDAAILQAAVELLAGGGLATFSMDAVAERAGTSKATIYRRWPHKEALVVDAIHQAAARFVGSADTGSLRGDARALVRGLVAALRSDVGRALAALTAEAAHDPVVRQALREDFQARRIQAVAAMLGRAYGRGEVRGDVDVELLVDVASGFLMHRLHMNPASLDEQLADKLVDLLLDGLLVRPGPEPEPGFDPTARAHRS